LEFHEELLRELGFFQSPSGWTTLTGLRVRTKQVLWFLKGHLAVFPSVQSNQATEALSDEAMYEIFAKETESSELVVDESHGTEDSGRDSVREDVREQAMKSVRGSTKAANQRVLSWWRTTYEATATVLGFPSDDYYLKRTVDPELRSLVVCRFLIHLHRIEGKKKVKLGRCLCAVRYFFACEGQPSDVFGSDLVTRVRDSCGYSASETRTVVMKRASQPQKLPVPASFFNGPVR